MRFLGRHIFLLLVAALFGLTEAAPSDDSAQSPFYKDSVEAEQHALDTLIDYDGYYTNLIRQEDDKISHDVLLGIAGGALTVIGTVVTIVMINDWDNYDDNYANELFHETALIGSVSFIVIGVPALSFGLYRLFRDTGSNSKRESYQRAFEIYKSKKPGTKGTTSLHLLPSVDIFNASAGINLWLQF